MNLIETLEKQIKLLDEINEKIKESNPEQVRENIETIDNLVRTIHLLETEKEM